MNREFLGYDIFKWLTQNNSFGFCFNFVGFLVICVGFQRSVRIWKKKMATRFHVFELAKLQLQGSDLSFKDLSWFSTFSLLCRWIVIHIMSATLISVLSAVFSFLIRFSYKLVASYLTTRPIPTAYIHIIEKST